MFAWRVSHVNHSTHIVSATRNLLRSVRACSSILHRRDFRSRTSHHDSFRVYQDLASTEQIRVAMGCRWVSTTTFDTKLNWKNLIFVLRIFNARKVYGLKLGDKSTIVPLLCVYFLSFFKYRSGLYQGTTSFGLILPMIVSAMTLATPKQLGMPLPVYPATIVSPESTARSVLASGARHPTSGSSSGVQPIIPVHS